MHSSNFMSTYKCPPVCLSAYLSTYLHVIYHLNNYSQQGFQEAPSFMVENLLQWNLRGNNQTIQLQTKYFLLSAYFINQFCPSFINQFQPKVYTIQLTSCEYMEQISCNCLVEDKLFSLSSASFLHLQHEGIVVNYSARCAFYVGFIFHLNLLSFHG